MILSPFFFFLVTWVKKFKNDIKPFDLLYPGHLLVFGINIVSTIG